MGVVPETLPKTPFYPTSTLRLGTRADVETSTFIDINKGAAIFAGGLGTSNDVEVIETLEFSDANNGSGQYTTNHNLKSDSNFNIVFDANLTAISDNANSKDFHSGIDRQFAISRGITASDNENVFVVNSIDTNNVRIGMGKAVSADVLEKDIEMVGDVLIHDTLDVSNTLVVSTSTAESKVFGDLKVGTRTLTTTESSTQQTKLLSSSSTSNLITNANNESTITYDDTTYVNPVVDISFSGGDTITIPSFSNISSAFYNNTATDSYSFYSFNVTIYNDNEESTGTPIFKVSLTNGTSSSDIEILNLSNNDISSASTSHQSSTQTLNESFMNAAISASTLSIVIEADFNTNSNTNYSDYRVMIDNVFS